MEIKRTELMALANTLATLNEQKLSSKCAYGISKNIKNIANEVTIIEEIRKTIETDYETARKELCEKYCDKNEDGTAKVENDNYIGLVGNEEFSTAMMNLSNDLSPRITEFNELLQGTVTIDLYQIDVELLPELKPSEMTSLLHIIKD